MKRRWKILISVPLVLLAVLAIYLTSLHTKSKSELERYKDQLRAKGEKLEISEVAPTPVPPAENSADVLRDAFKLLDSSSGLTYSNEPWAMHMISPGKAMIGWAQPAAHVYSMEGNQDINSWDQIGLALDVDRAGLELLTSLTNGSEFDFQLDYSKGFDLLLTHLAPLKRGAQKLSAAAIYCLHRGDVAMATTNTSSMLALVEGSQNERIIISQLVRIAIGAIAFNANWELLQSTNLTDSQLAALQKHWERLQFIQPTEDAFLMERADALLTMTKIRGSSSEFDRLVGSYASFGGLGTSSSSYSGSGGWLEGLGDWAKDEWDNTKFAAGRLLWHISWSYTDELHLLQADQLILESLRVIQKNAVFQPMYSNMVEQLDKLRISSGGGLAAKLDFELIREMLDESGSSQAAVRKVMAAEVTKCMAIAAIALKRYQLKNGNYPSDLSQLTPEFVSAVPMDPIDGKPLRYHLNSDGTFLLYSIGDNSVDDGGNATPIIPTTSYYWQRGLDWVWPQPATAAEVQSYFEHPPK